jgi:hypothetical protein
LTGCFDCRRQWSCTNCRRFGKECDNEVHQFCQQSH